MQILNWPLALSQHAVPEPAQGPTQGACAIEHMGAATRTLRTLWPKPDGLKIRLLSFKCGELSGDPAEAGSFKKLFVWLIFSVTARRDGYGWYKQPTITALEW